MVGLELLAVVVHRVRCVGEHAEPLEHVDDVGAAEEARTAEGGRLDAGGGAHHGLVEDQPVLQLLGEEGIDAGDREELVAHGLVVQGVEADLVARSGDALGDLGIGLGRDADPEEGPLGAVLVEELEEAGRALADAAIAGGPAPDVGLHVDAHDHLETHAYAPFVRDAARVRGRPRASLTARASPGPRCPSR